MKMRWDDIYVICICFDFVFVYEKKLPVLKILREQHLPAHKYAYWT